MLSILCVAAPMLAAVLCLPLRKSPRAQQSVTILAALGVLLAAIAAAVRPETAAFSLLSLSFHTGGFQGIYGVVTAFMWLCASLLTPQYFRHHTSYTRYGFFFLLTLGATMGVFYSADLMTTYVFFEIMSLSSYLWVVEEQTPEAMSAGKTYLIVAVLGGMVCLMGLFLLYAHSGTLAVDELYAAVQAAGKSPRLYAASFCLLVGFGAKAGLFPLHIWLPKAHPVAPAPASALLSGILTKTGLFGILIVTGRILRNDRIWGCTLLTVAVITMVLGAVLAVFSNNLKRTLACSSLSQIGFITVGIGMMALLGDDNALAANGTVLYMLNHSLVKLVLFLSAGAIYLGAHTLDLNRLRGYGRRRPVIMIPFLCGACSLAGVPGFAGYLAKTLVHESIVEFAPIGGPLITVVEWLFLISGGLTAAYMLKLFITLFVYKPTADTPAGTGLTLGSAASLWLSLAALIALGVAPHALTDRIAQVMMPFIHGQAFSAPMAYYSLANLKGVAISLGIGVVVYALIIRLWLMKKENGLRVHVQRWPAWLSLETLVYVPVCRALLWLMTGLSRLCNDACDLLALLISKTVLRPSKEQERPKHQRLAMAIGRLVDRAYHGDKEVPTGRALDIYHTLSSTASRIAGNFSFALLMTCLGICVILVLLLAAM